MLVPPPPPQEPIIPEKQVEQILEEAMKEYEDYLSLETVILKEMGLLPDTDKVDIWHPNPNPLFSLTPDITPRVTSRVGVNFMSVNFLELTPTLVSSVQADVWCSLKPEAFHTTHLTQYYKVVQLKM